MSALALDYRYRYLQPSQLAPARQDSSTQALQLATFSDASEPHPYFFSGQLTNPRQTAQMLRGLMQIVRVRFHVPAAMLERILMLADPVVTCSDARLRFEGFSSCCGVYARVDLLPDALHGESFGRGTTNVDFNQPMLNALATVRDTDDVAISVGLDRVALSKNSETVVEKRVKLPFRWLKGLVEVQACQSRMQLVHEIAGLQARRFFKSLPRMNTSRRETFIVAAGNGLRLSQVASAQAVRVGGLQRLRVLEGLASQARMLRIYTDATTGASGWELDFEDSRFHLVISPEVWRGFSGEGQALQSLAAADFRDATSAVHAQLKWQAVVDFDQLAGQVNFPPDVIRGALTVLGARGLVGYDLGEAAYFHRELPFDLSQAEKLQPRLKNARKLIAENKVRVGKQSATETEVFVTGTGVEHRVLLTADNAKCTCPWYAKHGSTRGPCKHILAARTYLEADADE